MPGGARRWLPGRRCRSISGKLQLCCLIACIQTALPVAPVLLCELHKVRNRGVIGEGRLQEAALLVYEQCIMDQLHEPRQVLGVVTLEAEGFLEVPIVIEAKILLRETWPVRIVQVLLEGMQEEVDLIARAQQEPIFVDKVGKQRLAVANITDILDCKYIQLFDIDLWILLLRRLVALLFRLLLLRLRPLGQQGLALVGVLPIGGQLTPLLQALLPLGPRLLERIAWFEVFHTLRQLLRKDPVLEHFGGLALGLPMETNIIEALLFRGQREACVRLRQHAVCNVRAGKLPVAQRLLLVREFHNDLFALRFLLGLLLLFLGLFLLSRVFLAIPLPLRSLARLIRLLPLFLNQALALLLGGLFLPLRGSLFLLIRKDELLDLSLVLCGRLTHNHSSNFLEVM
mmetsp:Transcript_65268/g.164526  ORF Transcript_65268/g.164526 Transcript_65268/m.164526 type:complete len:400 (+) Transcript_65268:311-1510(+)